MMKTADAIAALREKTGAVQKAVAEKTGAVVKAAVELFTPAHATFSEVFKKELETIQQRSKSPGAGGGGDSPIGLPENEGQSQIFRDVLQALKSSDEAWQSARKLKPDEFRHTGLVGLALSGGGIRSATFNLGVLQVLNEAGIFDKAHYLSTVSGGGYIGCCLNSIHSSGTARFPFYHRVGEVENQCFKHLREYSNYLAPHGLLDKLRMPALFLRGLFLNFVLILPFVLAAAGLYVLLIKQELIPDLQARFREFYFTGWALLIAAASFLVYPVLNRIFGVAGQSVGTWISRDEATRALGFYLGFVLVIAFVEVQPYAIDAYRFMADYDLGGLLRNASLSDIVGAVVGLLTALSAIAGARRVRTAGTVTGNVGLYFVGILGPLLLWLLFLLLAKRSLITGSGAIENFVFDYAIPVSYFGSPPEDRALQYLLAGAIIFAAGWFVNVNDYSLHSFYRDRLSRAYLMKGDGSTPPEHNDEQKLSSVNTAQMPYHIINAALNVTRQAKDRTDELRLPGRTAESFIFTKLYVGSDLTEYCKTESMERSDPWLNLGTAMAISGAAFAPNMGNVTIKPLVFILAMLNIRLGYWLQNPRSVNRGWFYARAKIPGRWLLFKELVSTLDEKDDYVNVSDGGHMDNLGVYELLRRRCRLIIASDAEADPNYQLEGLAVVSRLARIDMGIDLQFSCDELDMIRNGVRHYAVGTIDYGNSVTGKIIYVKASLIGCNDTVYVDRYKRLHTAFPHQTTLDQFFDEEQFECYRALGFHIARSVFLA